MKIKRRHIVALSVLIVLVAAGILVGCGWETGDFHFCESGPGGSFCCTGYAIANGAGQLVYLRGTCSGEAIEWEFGCPVVTIMMDCEDGLKGCEPQVWCGPEHGGDIWLADVCEAYDGFSEDGAMTWDSSFPGPLQFGATMDGPWHEVEVNGPPWVVTEEHMESFAGLVGVEDWHDMWVRSGEGYPQHVGNTVMERDARMDELCSVE
jgi:hypothetical protein